MPSTVNDNSYTFSFSDPRLSMTLGGRMVVRTVTWVFYVCFAAAVFLGIFSDISHVRWLSIGCALFLIDRIAHRGEADVPISELPKSGAINVGRYMRPKTFSILERAFDRSVITKGDFFLEATKKLMDDPNIKSAFARLDVRADEFIHKLDDLLAESAKNAPASAADVRAMALKNVKYLRRRRSRRLSRLGIIL